jgi:hypothetical protein
MSFFIFEGRKTIQPKKEERRKEEQLKEVHKGRPFYNCRVTPLVTPIAFEACAKMCFSTFTHGIVNVWSLNFFLMTASSVTRQLQGVFVTLVGAQTKKGRRCVIKT